jgi:KDO2-lipid IV(A) lauroyltransferase
MANWDWAGAWACATGVPLMTVAERLEPVRVYDEFVRFRSSLGMRILPLTGGEPPMPALERWASEGGFVCLLSDRDLSRTSVEVELGGNPARMPSGPARLAQRTGADLVPVTLAYRGDDLEITFHERVDPGTGEDGVVAATRQVAGSFSRALAADPQDWHMMQRVFSADLSARVPS